MSFGLLLLSIMVTMLFLRGLNRSDVLERLLESVFTLICLGDDARNSCHKDLWATCSDSNLVHDLGVEVVTDRLLEVLATPVEVLNGIEIYCVAECMGVILDCVQLELSRVLDEVDQLVGLGIPIHEDMVHAILDAVSPDDILVGLEVDCRGGIVTALKTVELDASIGSACLLHFQAGM